jgi:signal transduction histidine kinase
MTTNREMIQALLLQIESLKKENEAYQSNEKMFQALVETAVSDIGEEFFCNIISRLSEWLNAECVIIGQMIGENVVEGFPMYLDGKIVQGFTYELKNTPCDMTSRKGFCVYPENVRAAFPKSKDLRELDIQGYVGTALYDKKGIPNGILCAMSRSKLDLPPQAEKIMKIVGARITAEIERKKIQRALEISEAKLREANLSKDKVFSIIGHDLKSSFNSLIGFSQLLLGNVHNADQERIERYVKVIHEVSVQTHTLLENLLEWALVQTDSKAFDPVDFSLTELLSETSVFYRNQALQKGITLKTQVREEVSLHADRNMITTVLRNLLSNAIKYTLDGGVITLSVSSSDNQVNISVADTGVGMKPDYLNNLFSMENKFSTAGTNSERGTGLGLILCKEFVEKHHGTLVVESKEGKGSKFLISIPQVKLMQN